MTHCSTVQERVSRVSQMLANPVHGLLSQWSRSHQVSRQTFKLEPDRLHQKLSLFRLCSMCRKDSALAGSLPDTF